MWVFGVILILVAAGLAWSSRSSQKRVARLSLVQRRTASELASLSSSIAAELGAGSFREPVELVGSIKSADPLISPLGQRQCVYYQMSVTRRYEEDAWRKDSNGRRERYTQSGTETVNDDTQSREFRIDDGTGQVLVLPDGADFDTLETSVSRFEPGEGEVATLRFGDFTMSVPSGGGGRRQTLGYQYEEKIVPLGRRVTVIGQATDRNGTLAVANSPEHPLTISSESREEQIEGGERGARFKLIAAGVSAVAGVVLVVVGIVTG